ncbi:hypothetical protein StoSoilB5_31270 [Arthrobacter sp. StoSoilB5]|nr:hypothetical protein StoSoilB5_31270 [Arthrobacter sp. StoSoilB5]
MGGGDGIPDHVRGKGNCKVTGVAVDPVSDDLHPPVSVTGFLADRLHELVRLDFMAQAAQVPAAACDVAACPDESGQVLALLDPSRVAGRPSIADQQRAGLKVRLRLGKRSLLIYRPTNAKSNMAMGVNKTGKDPSVQHGIGRCGGTLEGQPAIDGPQPVPLVVSCHKHRSAEFDDVLHGKSLVGPVASGSTFSDMTGVQAAGCGSFVYDHTGALAGAEIGLTQSATVEPVRVMPAKEVSNP